LRKPLYIPRDPDQVLDLAQQAGFKRENIEDALYDPDADWN
jgi:hypothetical protein